MKDNNNGIEKEIVTVSDIKAAAASMFEDPRVMSVDVQAKWGLVRVLRNGDVYAY